MKAYPTVGILTLTGLALLFSLIACSPKHIVNGRVVDAETQQPIKGAVLAIRWMGDKSEKDHDENAALEAFQVLTDDKGTFQIPDHPHKKYILGVYKQGYICWSSRDIFMTTPDAKITNEYRKRKHHRIGNGMEIELKPFRPKGASRKLHADFAIMVASEITDSHDGPFHRAIASEYRIWREGLRKDFQKKFGKKPVAVTHKQ